MGFGKSNALALQDEDINEQVFDEPPQTAVDETADLAAAFAVPSEGIDFAPPIVDVPPPANDEIGRVAPVLEASQVANEDPFIHRLQQSLEARSGDDVAAMELAPALPPIGTPTPAPHIRAPGTAPGGPAPAPLTSPAPPVDAGQVVPQEAPTKEDLGLSAEQIALLDSLGEQEREELLRSIRAERASVEQERQRLAEEAKRRALMPPATGVAALAAMAGNMFLKSSLERRQTDFRRREAFLQSGFVTDRYFDLKRRDFLRMAGSVASTHAELSGAVRSYNESFAATEPGRRYLDRIERLVNNGMQRPAAEAFVREGNVVGAAEDAAAAANDPRVVAAKAVVDAKATDLEGKARKFGSDFQLLQKNFPDKLADSAAGEVAKTFDRIAKDTPKPVAEPGTDPQQTLEKRLERMAEGIRELVESVMRIVRSILPGRS